MNALATITRWITAPVRYWGEVLGEKDYEKYVAHLKRHHPGCPIPTEREYWHKRWADQETNPGSRCC